MGATPWRFKSSRPHHLNCKAPGSRGLLVVNTDLAGKFLLLISTTLSPKPPIDCFLTSFQGFSKAQSADYGKIPRFLALSISVGSQWYWLWRLFVQAIVVDDAPDA